MTKTVYVLGAGSSACARGPLVSEFKEASSRAVNLMREGDSKSRMLAALGYWEGTVPKANVEEYYVLVDLLNRLGRTPDPLGEKRQDDTKYLIAKTLEMAMGTEVSPTHEKFLETVVSGPRKEGVVISLNWDIAYDHAVSSSYGAYALDYGYGKASPTETERRDVQQATFALYKLHGSTNWWFCTTCSTLWYSAYRKGAPTHWERYERQTCKTSGCRGELVPFMIPPSSQKFESSEFVQPLTEVWGKARAELAGCSEVFFVGYSFPATDIQFKMLVIEALSSNPRLETLAVVTNPKFGTDRAAFEDHYSDVFSDPKLRNKLKFKYATFEDWVTRDSGSLLEPARYS